MKTEDLYFTAEQAAAYLNVSKQTLYSYVGRKKIRTLQEAGGRQRLYWRNDIEALTKQGQSSSKQATTDGLVSETKITLCNEDGLYYRGINVETLAQSSSIEEVAALLWEVDEKDVFTDELPQAPDNLSKINSYSSGLSTISRTAMLLPLIEASNPHSYDMTRRGYARTSVDVLRSFTSIIVGADNFSNKPIHEYVTKALNAPPAYADILRKLMIFAADHGIDPVTYAVRASANAGVTPYEIVLAGQAVHHGRRLYASRIETTARFVDEILNANDPASSILSRCRAGEDIPGFTPRDTIVNNRAAPFLRALEESIAEDRDFKKLKATINLAHEITGSAPEFFLLIVFVSRKLGLKDPLGVAAIGRVIGMIAHAMEQYFTHDLYQPQPAYTGELPRTGK